jgi:hypothetical protein
VVGVDLGVGDRQDENEIEAEARNGNVFENGSDSVTWWWVGKLMKFVEGFIGIMLWI